MKGSKPAQEDTSQWIKTNISNKFEEVPEKFTAEIIERSEMPPNPSNIPDATILHKIVVRENLINEIKRLIRHQNDIDAARSEVSELVKAIRYQSLDIVDEISQWKSNQTFSRDFLYRGENYLVKMYSDLNFLDNYDEFNFGFPVSSNPFIFPYNGVNRLPESLRFTSSSVDGGSGFVSRKVHMEDEILVDGIEVSRLQMCDNIIREEVQKKQNKNTKKKHTHPDGHGSIPLHNHSVIGVGENAMNDSYMSPAFRDGHYGGGPSVSFRDTADTMHEPSAVSYQGSHLPPLQQHSSYVSQGQSNEEPSFASIENPPPAPSSNNSNYPNSTASGVKKGRSKKSKTESVNIKTIVSPPAPSKRSVPSSKWVVKTKQVRQMKDRCNALSEEMGVVKAMHAHVCDQVDFKVAEHQRLTEIRDNLEKKRKQAVYQDRPTRAQDYAVKVNVADMELQQLHFTVKDLQRQRFFFEQEVKRKKQTLRRLEKDIEDVTKQTILQKKLEKRAKSEGLLAVLKSRNTDPSLYEDDVENSNGVGASTMLSDDESVLTTEEGIDSEENEKISNLQLTSSLIDSKAPETRIGVSTMDSTFSANIEPNTIVKKNPEEATIEEELPSPNPANITFLNNEDGDLIPPRDISQEEGTSVILDDNLGKSSDDAKDSNAPVVAGSGYSFAKQSSSNSSTKDSTVEDKSAGDATVGSNDIKHDEILVKEKVINIREEVISVKVYSNESAGTTTLRAYDDKGNITLAYELIPALASQIKDLDEEEISTFLTDMLDSTILIPSESRNMNTEYETDISKKEHGAVSNENSAHSEIGISPDHVYEVMIGDVKYSSRIQAEDDEIKIYATNVSSGKNHVIPVLPVLAKQMFSLTYDQICGVITDIIFSGYDNVYQ